MRGNPVDYELLGGGRGVEREMGTWEQRRHAAMLVTEAAAAEERQKHHPGHAGGTGEERTSKEDWTWRAHNVLVCFFKGHMLHANCASNNNTVPLLVTVLLRNEEKFIFNLLDSTALFRKCTLKAPIRKSVICDITKGRMWLNLIWSLTPGAGYTLWELTARPPPDNNVLSPTQLWGNNHADAFYRKLNSSIVAMAVNRGLNTPFAGDPFFLEEKRICLLLWRPNRKSNMGTEKILCSNVSAAMLKACV